jgi:hypothetical protein
LLTTIGIRMTAPAVSSTRSCDQTSFLLHLFNLFLRLVSKSAGVCRLFAFLFVLFPLAFSRFIR